MNGVINGALATCAFELKRSFTIQRTAVSLVLSLFPPTMLGLMVFGSIIAARTSRDENATAQMAEFAPFVSVFLVAIVVLLSLLLWATPNIYSELEGKSWSFIASRPNGRVAMFLGKFLASVIVAFGISVVAVTMCILIASVGLGIVRPERTWMAMVGIYLLASLVYAALFSVIGTLFHRRAMVVAAGFLIGFDVLLASVPGALVNKFTIRFHLQEIGIHWLGWFLPASGPQGLQEYRMIFGSQWSVWSHLGILVGGTIALLGLGCYVIVNREFVTSDSPS